jgi:hypothetical protein
MNVNVRALAATAWLALGCAALVAAQAPENPGTYTAEQATASEARIGELPRSPADSPRNEIDLGVGR